MKGRERKGAEEGGRRGRKETEPRFVGPSRGPLRTPEDGKDREEVGSRKQRTSTGEGRNLRNRGLQIPENGVMGREGTTAEGKVAGGFRGRCGQHSVARSPRRWTCLHSSSSSSSCYFEKDCRTLLGLHFPHLPFARTGTISGKQENGWCQHPHGRCES